MTLTSDEITIANEALGYAGEYTISSSDSSTKQYELCERYYDISLKEVLSKHIWNEAKKRAILIEDATAPLFSYNYRFALPDDFVRIAYIDGIDQYEDSDKPAWEVEDGYIMTRDAHSPPSYTVGDEYVAGQYLTYSDITYLVDTSFTATDWDTDSANLTSQGDDYNILQIEYIYNLTDITKWSPNLRKAIAQGLAIKILPGLTNDPSSKRDLINEFESLTMPQSRSIDAQQGKMRPIFRSQWLRARY